MSKYSDNAAKSGGTFEAGVRHGNIHMFRVGKAPASSFVEFLHKNETNMSWAEADQIENDLIAEAQQNYYRRYRQKMQVKNPIQELVINIRENHTMRDVQAVADMVRQEFGYIPVGIAIHRDEGHWEGDTFVANQHAHIRFFTLDLETGKSLYRKAANKRSMSKFQDRLAEILGMERGRKDGKSKHIHSRDYREVADRVETATLEDLQRLNRELRDTAKALGCLTRDDWRALESFVNEIKGRLGVSSVQDLQSSFTGFLEHLQNNYVEHQDFQSEIAKLRNENEKWERQFRDFEKEYSNVCVENQELRQTLERPTPKPKTTMEMSGPG